jgi:hypothetical protein
MRTETYGPDGDLIAADESGPDLFDTNTEALDAVASIRTHAATMSASSNTRKALEAAADALEALLS